MGDMFLNLTLKTIPSEAFFLSQASSRSVGTSLIQDNSGRLKLEAAQILVFQGFKNTFM